MAVLSLKPFIGSLALLSISLVACQKDLSGNSKNESEQVAKAAKPTTNDGVLVESICFKAIALVAGCKEGVTENIEFTGIIENKVQSTQTGSGNTNYTRHFVVKGLTGKGTMGTTLTPATGPVCSRTAKGGYTGTTYEVIGGAEMFSIHYTGTGAVPSVAGSNIYIHQGTLVFENTVTKERIVARHTIRKTPGQDLVSMWTCGGGGSDGSPH